MKFRDLFTYQADVSGKRRLRTYVKAAIFILAALIVLWVVSYYQQSRTQQAVEETKPVVLPSLPPTIQEIATSIPEPTSVTESCPTDPANWTLTEGLPGTEFMRIEPACVYEGLERTVAFALGITEGYSRQEVAEKLGFEKLPMTRLSQVTIANPNGPLSMDVGFEIDVPPFKEWIFREDGKPAEAMALQGCFRTYTIVGNEKKNWDKNSYPVVCRVSYDNVSTAGVFCMGDSCYSIASNPVSNRRFTLFGYAGNNRWIWLGTEKDTVNELDSQTMSEDRAVSAQMQGTGPWDRDWLKQTYGLEMQPLPENWELFAGEADKKAVRDAINAYSAGTTNP
jgi:hypothetical protein